MVKRGGKHGIAPFRGFEFRRQCAVSRDDDPTGVGSQRSEARQRLDSACSNRRIYDENGPGTSGFEPAWDGNRAARQRDMRIAADDREGLLLTGKRSIESDSDARRESDTIKPGRECERERGSTEECQDDAFQASSSRDARDALARVIFMR